MKMARWDGLGTGRFLAVTEPGNFGEVAGPHGPVSCRRRLVPRERGTLIIKNPLLLAKLLLPSVDPALKQPPLPHAAV